MRIKSRIFSAILAVLMLGAAACSTNPSKPSISPATETIANTVSAGTDFCAAIMKDGSLYTWGRNIYGQLGNGTTEDSKSPVKVLEDAALVSCGSYHAAALKKDGTLWAWGLNVNGQVGNGGISNTGSDYGWDEGLTSPAKVLDDVVDVVCANSATTALTKDGSIYVWGAVHDIRYDNMLVSGDVLTPTKVATDAKKLTGVRSYINKSGELITWGINNWGESGITAFGKCIVPEKVLDDVVYAHTSSECSYAIKSDGTLLGCGKYEPGIFGSDDIKVPSGVYSYQALPSQVFGDVIYAVPNGDFSAFITSDNALYMCGSNRNFCIGNDNGGEEYDNHGLKYNVVKTPVKVLENAAFASVGDSVVIAVTKDGALYIWGIGPLGGIVGNYVVPDINNPCQTVPYMLFEAGSILLP